MQAHSERESLSVGECDHDGLSDETGLRIQTQGVKGRGPEIATVVIGNGRPTAKTNPVDAAAPCLGPVEFYADAPILLEHGADVAFTPILTPDQAATLGEATDHSLTRTSAIEDELVLEDGKRCHFDHRHRLTARALEGHGGQCGVSDGMKHDRKHAVGIHQIASSLVRSLFDHEGCLVIREHST